jgi:hypothetical protein
MRPKSMFYEIFKQFFLRAFSKNQAHCVLNIASGARSNNKKSNNNYYKYNPFFHQIPSFSFEIMHLLIIAGAYSQLTHQVLYRTTPRQSHKNKCQYNNNYNNNPFFIHCVVPLFFNFFSIPQKLKHINFFRL